MATVGERFQLVIERDVRRELEAIVSLLP